MDKINNPHIGYRFYILRQLLFLKVDEIYFLTGIPVSNLRRIERGEIVSANEVQKLADLYNIDLDIILNVEILLPTWKELRRKGLAKHRDNEYYLQAIDKEPKVKKAIKFRLLQSDFFNSEKSTTDAQAKLSSLYRWKYSISALAFALSTLPYENLLEEIKHKGKTKRYRKSRKNPKEIWLIPDRIVTELEEITAAEYTDFPIPEHHKMAGMLLTLRNGPKNSLNILKSVSYANSHNNIRKSLGVLRNLGLVKMTEEHENSSLQMYGLTEKGQALLEKVGLKV